MRVTADTIDALVSGELDAEQYRQALRVLDRDPDGWKTCALAFLQEQALSQDLKRIAAGTIGSSEAGATDELLWDSPGACKSLSNPLLKQSAWQGADRVHKPSAEPHPSRLEWLSRLTSLAALLLISFTIGWFGSDVLDWSPSQTSRSAADEQSARSLRGPSAGDRRFAPAGASERGQLSDTDAGNFHYVSDELIPLDQPPPPYLEELHRSGRIDLESFDALVPVYEGDTVQLVPLRHYRVRPKVFSF